jgi:hypothetical protein
MSSSSCHGPSRYGNTLLFLFNLPTHLPPIPSRYGNALLFLSYLFVAIFILLSMFLAILAEAQSTVRQEIHDATQRGEEVDEYGVCSTAYDYILRSLQYARLMSPPVTAAKAAEQPAAGEEDPSIEPIRALGDSVMDLKRQLTKLSDRMESGDRPVERGGVGGAEKSRQDSVSKYAAHVPTASPAAATAGKAPPAGPHRPTPGCPLPLSTAPRRASPRLVNLCV